MRKKPSECLIGYSTDLRNYCSLASAAATSNSARFFSVQRIKFIQKYLKMWQLLYPHPRLDPQTSTYGALTKTFSLIIIIIIIVDSIAYCKLQSVVCTLPCGYVWERLNYRLSNSRGISYHNGCKANQAFPQHVVCEAGLLQATQECLTIAVLSVVWSSTRSKRQ